MHAPNPLRCTPHGRRRPRTAHQLALGADKAAAAAEIPGQCRNLTGGPGAPAGPLRRRGRARPGRPQTSRARHHGAAKGGRGRREMPRAGREAASEAKAVPRGERGTRRASAREERPRAQRRRGRGQAAAAGGRRGEAAPASAHGREGRRKGKGGGPREGRNATTRGEGSGRSGSAGTRDGLGCRKPRRVRGSADPRGV